MPQRQMDAFRLTLKINGLFDIVWKNQNSPDLIDTKILPSLERDWTV